MTVFDKIVIFLALLGWIGGGFFLMKNFKKFFGPHPDDPSETSAARMLGQTQIWSIWIGIALVGFYYLVK